MYQICWIYMNRFLGLLIWKGCTQVACQYFDSRKTSWTACNGERHRRGNSERQKKRVVGVCRVFFFKPPSSPNRILREVYVQTNCLCAHLKVCHSSAFQTISARQIIINHSDSVLAILNNTMQTKQHATIKTNSYSNRNKIYKELLFVEEGSLAENVQNLQFLLIQ